MMVLSTYQIFFYRFPSFWSQIYMHTYDIGWFLSLGSCYGFSKYRWFFFVLGKGSYLNISLFLVGKFSGGIQCSILYYIYVYITCTIYSRTQLATVQGHVDVPFYHVDTNVHTYTHVCTHTITRSPSLLSSTIRLLLYTYIIVYMVATIFERKLQL